MDSATQVLHGPRLLSRGGLLGCNPRRPLHLCLPQPLLHLSRARPLARQIRLRRRPRRPLLLKLRRQFSPPHTRRLRLLLGGPCRLLGRPRLCLRRLQPPSVRILLHLRVTTRGSRVEAVPSTPPPFAAPAGNHRRSWTCRGRAIRAALVLLSPRRREALRSSPQTSPPTPGRAAPHAACLRPSSRGGQSRAASPAVAAWANPSPTTSSAREA
mmetsp:Transcript_1615/g.4547  ORF Transcript_1615/g.4547 Transcript_1615/m.4547 type:complete len:213 (-) Transcript_1615:452-1090(-)